MSAKHSTPVRGLLRGGQPPAAPQSFQGRFGKMFPAVPEARFGNSAQFVRSCRRERWCPSSPSRRRSSPACRKD